MNVTVIGSGNMGGALVRGWARAARQKRVEDISLTATAHTNARLDVLKADFPEVTVTTDNVEAVRNAEFVIIAVKPWMVEGVMAEIAGALREDAVVVSVAASVTHPAIDVYTMPNIAVEFGTGMIFIKQNDAIPADVMQTIHDLYALCGKVMFVDERQMNAGNMLAGCGIAYVMRMVRAMMEGGVEMGLYPNVAKEIAMQAMQGAVSVLEGTGLHPEAAIDKVTTAGGLTIKGLNELDHAGFNSAVIRCLKAGLTR